MGGQVRIRRASGASVKSHHTSGTWSVTSGSNTAAAEPRRQQQKSRQTPISPHSKDTSLKSMTATKRQRSGMLGAGCPLGRNRVVVPSDNSVDSHSKMDEEGSVSTANRSLCSSEKTQYGREEPVDYFDRNMILSELASLRAENASLTASKLEASTLRLENSRLREENEVVREEYQRVMEAFVTLKEENETLIAQNKTLKEESEGCRGLLVDALKTVRQLEDEAEASAKEQEAEASATSQQVTERAEKMRDALMGLTQVTCEQEDRISTLWLKLDSTRRQVAEKDMTIERLRKDRNKSSRRKLKRIPENSQKEEEDENENRHQKEIDQLRLHVAKKMLLIDEDRSDATSTTEAETESEKASSCKSPSVSDQELDERAKEQLQGVLATLNEADEDGNTEVLRNKLQEKIERIVLLELDLEVTRDALQSIRDNGVVSDFVSYT